MVSFAAKLIAYNTIPFTFLLHPFDIVLKICGDYHGALKALC